jgi:hypothetical protein
VLFHRGDEGLVVRDTLLEKKRAELLSGRLGLRPRGIEPVPGEVAALHERLGELLLDHVRDRVDQGAALEAEQPLQLAAHGADDSRPPVRDRGGQQVLEALLNRPRHAHRRGASPALAAQRWQSVA